MLQVQNIHQYYGGSHILRDVSLSAKAGQVTVLLGRNGIGGRGARALAAALQQLATRGGDGSGKHVAGGNGGGHSGGGSPVAAAGVASGFSFWRQQLPVNAGGCTLELDVCYNSGGPVGADLLDVAAAAAAPGRGDGGSVTLGLRVVVQLCTRGMYSPPAPHLLLCGVYVRESV